MKTPDEIRQSLVDRAVEDSDFRSRLIADPKQVIKQEFDIDVPDAVGVHVHEDSGETAHLVLPPDPRLTDSELTNVSGGKTVYMYWCM